MNEVLRRALAESGLDAGEVAARLGVDPKTVQRWISGHRTPYAHNRMALTRLLGVDETAAWPHVTSTLTSLSNRAADLRAFYPHRSTMHHRVWWKLFTSARREIGILAYAGLFLAEDDTLMQVIADRARNGVTVRILLGDPDSPYVADRGEDEGIGDSIAAKIRNALVLYRPLRDIGSVEIRLHRTTLYASIYRADGELLVNPHIYGIPAANAPVLHLHKTEDGDMANTYLTSFERVWTTAQPSRI